MDIRIFFVILKIFIYIWEQDIIVYTMNTYKPPHESYELMCLYSELVF